MAVFDWMAAAKRSGLDGAVDLARGGGSQRLQPLGQVCLRCVMAIAMVLSVSLAWPHSAQASIHTYPEPERQTTMYRSRLSLRDNQDLAWQTILFKRVKAGQVIELNLRLISFPGQLALSHPQALQVERSSSTTWKLPDETLLDPQLQSVKSSLAQYDAKSLLLTLERPSPLTLTVTLENGEQRVLLVPPYVVKEWLQLQEMPLG